MQLNGFSERAVTAALEVMDSHLFALNEWNTMALDGTLRYPDIFLIGIELKLWETTDRYFGDFKVYAGED